MLRRPRTLCKKVILLKYYITVQNDCQYSTCFRKKTRRYTQQNSLRINKIAEFSGKYMGVFRKIIVTQLKKDTFYANNASEKYLV